ncbi:hypothetical protein KAZ82_00100 [Candidatus Babeliales bacterium]|nr:hypothetical protein [Candidatus Babeliales bacterium]
MSRDTQIDQNSKKYVILGIMLLCVCYVSVIQSSDAYCNWIRAKENRLRIFQNNSAEENQKLMIAIINQTLSTTITTNPFCFFKYSMLAALLMVFKDQSNYYQLLLSVPVQRNMKACIAKHWPEYTEKILQIYDSIELFELYCRDLSLNDVRPFDIEHVILNFKTKHDRYIPYHDVSSILQTKFLLYCKAIIGERVL